MKRLLFTLLVLSLSVLLVGCNNIEEQRAENSIKQYYQALIEGNYETAFQELYLYEESYSNGQTSLSNSEAQTIYQEKIKYLNDQSYKVKDFEITELEYEDGNSFWHHVNIGVEQNGGNFQL
ncbi:hypothetical protein H7992_05175 [Sporosarcina sp. resist]|uniref:hypothetical protein n=1 Tax=Sporosarcina sp. resist TaxID=2762563 RepID=UPI00164D01D5|nr:hypothetical protein [Sporosarcina sp. resist]QNK89118.1 hypothetical protein H7992_05175 [Sporosarcina sp. resist]